MLLDPESFDLVQHVETVLAAIHGHELETADQPRADAVGARDRDAGLPHGRRRAPRARRRCAATSAASRARRGSASARPAPIPFSLFERQRITAKDRYRQLVDQLQYIARRELIFGMHVHVAVDDPDKAIKVVSGLLPQLAPLLALSASSPFWRGEPTGLASSRQMIFSAMPALGAAAALPRLRRLRRGRRPARAHGLHRRLHAHLVGRPPAPAARHDRDPDLRRASRGSRTRSRSPRTARRSSSSSASGTRPARRSRRYHRILTSENKWLAARYGLEAPVMDLATGRRNRIPIAQLVRRTLRELEPHARELGSERELEGVREILDRGNSADRQLRIWDANRDIVEVVAGDRDRDRDAARGLRHRPGLSDHRGPRRRLLRTCRRSSARWRSRASKDGAARARLDRARCRRPHPRRRPALARAGRGGGAAGRGDRR